MPNYGEDVEGQPWQLLELQGEVTKTLRDVNQCLNDLYAARATERDAVNRLHVAVAAMGQQNEILMAMANPDGVEVSAPAAMILKVIADNYGCRERTEWESETGQMWRIHMRAIDDIIARLNAGETMTVADGPELEWWSRTVLHSSGVLPNVVMFAFLELSYELRAQASGEAGTDGSDG